MSVGNERSKGITIQV